MLTDKPDSPHLMLGDITAEGYYSFAEHDTYVPLSDVAKFEKLLASAPFPSRVETEMGTLITATPSPIAATCMKPPGKSTTSVCWRSIAGTSGRVPTSP